MKVSLRLDAGMADLDELLVRELRLERLDEALSRFTGRIGDHVQLDEAHGASVLGGLTPLLGFMCTLCR